MKALFTWLINFFVQLFTNKESYDFNQKNLSGNSKPVPQRNSKYKHGKSWWRKLYLVSKRSEVGSLRFHVVKHFGNFSPVRPFAKRVPNTPKGKIK